MSEQFNLPDKSELQDASPQDPTLALGRPRAAAASRRADASARPEFPIPGEEFLSFRLNRKLGEGSFALVFQAEQVELARRPVVLKLSRIVGNEPQTLAQLQHTHIVPIYSVHEDPRRGLRAVCMPYFGGASLSSILQRLWSSTPHPDSGRQLREALEAAGAPRSCRDADSASKAPGAEGGEGLSFAPWDGLGYIRAAVWITAQLAEALQHAHQRGVLHRDVKPSNVLLADDGQPMLLDFNVAEQEGEQTMLGGTVAYMAPEHLRAIALRAPGFARRVDRRSDVYSLGLVLFEMLVGNKPFEASGSYSVELPQLAAMAVEREQTTPSIRKQRPEVSWTLESILRQCLAPAPEDRYQHAEHLAEDLRRFLEDQPLKYAPELSRSEQARKWMRRHPRLTSSASVATAAALVVLAVAAVLAGVWSHLARVQGQLHVARAEERWRAYEAGTIRALCLVNTAAGDRNHLSQGRLVCEEALALYEVLERDDWQDGADRDVLSVEQLRQLREDTRELLLLLAWARARNAPGDRQTLQANLDLLRRAEAIDSLPPSRALWQDRALYLAQLGDEQGAGNARKKAERIQPASARDHYELALSYAREGKYSRAVEELNRALELNPRHYWSSLQRGLCHLELGKHVLAAADFSVCIGLWPDLPWGHFNRGYCLEKTGWRAEAVADYGAALARDPGFFLAYRNRGMARLELREYGPALADLTEAIERGGPDAALLAGKGTALEGLRRHPEADAAFRAADRMAEGERDEVRTRIKWVYGFAVSERLPARALAAFDDVLKQQPHHPQALYGKAMLLVRKNQETEAVALFSRALEASPAFVEARRCRAVLLARSGQFAAASQDVNACLEKEPESGANLYAAACVASLAAAKTRDAQAARQAADQAIHFLRMAFARNYGRDQAATDADLKGIHGHPEFKPEVFRKQP